MSGKNVGRSGKKNQKQTAQQVDYCKDCGAKCCKYYTVPLDPPEDVDDFETFRWYILHDRTSIFIDSEGDWFVNIANLCRELTADGRCRIYKRRPTICRNHGHDVCERNDDGYDFREHFHDEHELMAYAAIFLRRRKEQSQRRSEAARKAWARRKGGVSAKEGR